MPENLSTFEFKINTYSEKEKNIFKIHDHTLETLENFGFGDIRSKVKNMLL